VATLSDVTVPYAAKSPIGPDEAHRLLVATPESVGRTRSRTRTTRSGSRWSSFWNSPAPGWLLLAGDTLWWVYLFRHVVDAWDTPQWWAALVVAVVQAVVAIRRCMR
jgi:hypothetical protein